MGLLKKLILAKGTVDLEQTLQIGNLRKQEEGKRCLIINTKINQI